MNKMKFGRLSRSYKDVRAYLFVSYFALHIYNAGEVFEERTVKQNEKWFDEEESSSGTEKRERERKTKETQISRVQVINKIRSEEWSSKYI